MVSTFATTGRHDAGTLRVSYGLPELDPVTHGWRHREFWVWREGGQKFGSWVWRPGLPPAEGDAPW